MSADLSIRTVAAPVAATYTAGMRIIDKHLYVQFCDELQAEHPELDPASDEMLELYFDWLNALADDLS